MCVCVLQSFSDYSEIHNIEDSDEEAYGEECNIQNVRQMPSSNSAKNDMQLPAKTRYDSEHTFDRDAKYSAKNASARIGSQCRNYIKSELQKQSASKLHRYLAVKKSIKWYVHNSHLITANSWHMNPLAVNGTQTLMNVVVDLYECETNDISNIDSINVMRFVFVLFCFRCRSIPKNSREFLKFYRILLEKKETTPTVEMAINEFDLIFRTDPL